MIADIALAGLGTATYVAMGTTLVYGGIVSARDRKLRRSETESSPLPGVILRAGEVPRTPEDVRGIEWTSDDDHDTVSEWLATLRQPTLF